MGKLIDNEPNSGYVSPVSICIERIRQDAEAEFEKNVLHAVLECGVVVDRDELIKALQYDRDQFQKGFAAGVEWAGPKWISVKDRLPEDCKKILVVNGHGYISISSLWRKDGSKWTWVDSTGHFNHVNDITHWMPLPLPPEGE